jgi:hypothetical protein
MSKAFQTQITGGLECCYKIQEKIKQIKELCLIFDNLKVNRKNKNKIIKIHICRWKKTRGKFTGSQDAGRGSNAGYTGHTPHPLYPYC